MSGDIQFNEVIRVMGGLETAVSTLNKQMDGISSDLKSITCTCTAFEAYARSRADLPERISALEDVARDYITSKPDREKDSETIKFLIKRYDAAMLAAAALNAIALVVVWLYQKGILTVGLG